MVRAIRLLLISVGLLAFAVDLPGAASQRSYSIRPRVGFSPTAFYLSIRSGAVVPRAKFIRVIWKRDGESEWDGAELHEVEQDDERFYLCLATPARYMITFQWLKQLPGDPENFKGVVRQEQASVVVLDSVAYQSGQTYCQ